MFLSCILTYVLWWSGWSETEMSFPCWRCTGNSRCDPQPGPGQPWSPGWCRTGGWWCCWWWWWASSACSSQSRRAWKAWRSMALVASSYFSSAFHLQGITSSCRSSKLMTTKYLSSALNLPSAVSTVMVGCFNNEKLSDSFTNRLQTSKHSPSSPPSRYTSSAQCGGRWHWSMWPTNSPRLHYQQVIYSERQLWPKSSRLFLLPLL